MFRWRPPLRAAALLVAVALLGGGDFDEAIHCEDAFAHLKACCPTAQFGPGDSCRGAGCTSGGQALTIDESACIEAQTCAEIRGAQICDRVAARTNPVDRICSTDVCPGPCNGGFCPGFFGVCP